MDAFGQVMQSEYANAGELLGLDGDNNTELMGYLNALDPVNSNVVKFSYMPL